MGKIGRYLRVVLLLAAATLVAAERVELKFNLPEGLGAYNGPQPVTLGIPFAEGVLRSEAGRRVVDEQGRPVSADLTVTATWGPDRQDIKWLLVDVAPGLVNGAAPRLFLEFGPEVAIDEPPPPPAIALDDPRFDPAQFVLVDGTGREFKPADVRTEIETPGRVRTTVHQTGRWVAADGTSIADYETRYRVYTGVPFYRVYHTLTWQTDDSVAIGRLAFRPGPADAGAVASAGLDGKPVSGAALELRQTGWDTVTGTATGRQLDGWATLGVPGQSLFAALRWPWQQHPVQIVAADGRLELRLIGPETALGLKPDDIAVEYVKAEKSTWNLRVFQEGKLWDMKYNGAAALPHLSPRGVAKTWEVLVWPGQAEIAPAVKNLLAQHPAIGYVEPAFAVQAALPSPASAVDRERFPVIEDALVRAFGWIARENPFDGDYGIWNWGDVQWAWTVWGFTNYRYWMNNGKGWSVVPWGLWLRSGDRRYYEHAEANSRHSMDIDLCHVPEWGYQPDGKIRGGQYHYSALQWGYGPEVSSFFVDSEYLPYAWYITGDERAREIMNLRAEALVRDRWQERVAYFTENRADRSRHLYVVLKDLAILYEATWRADLLPYLKAYLDLTLDAQEPDGSFVGIKSNHYLDQPLNIAARALPAERPRVLAAIGRWCRYQGNLLDATATAAASGPPSLWDTWNLARHGGDPRLLPMNLRLARAQAWCVGDDEGLWQGFTPFQAHLAGPILRDWVVAMAGIPPGQTVEGADSLLFLNSRLAVNPEAKQGQQIVRHVVLALKAAGEPLTVSFHAHLYNMGLPRSNPIAIYDPSSRMIAQAEFTTNVVHKMGEVKAGTSFTVDAGQAAGVYAFVITTPAPTMARASSGKVVAYLPPGQRTMVSPMGGGRVWFMPAGGEDVTVAFSLNMPEGRHAILDADGKLVASSRITGTDERKIWTGGVRQLPVAEPCRLPAAEIRPGLYQLFSGVADYKDLETIRGMKPWLANSREEWFDPSEHPCPDLDKVLAPPAP